jgi:hypothetical protein
MLLAFAVYFIRVEEGSLAHSPWGMAPPGVWAAKAYHLAPITKFTKVNLSKLGSVSWQAGFEKSNLHV